MNAPRLFPQANNAAPCGFCGSKMHVGHLRQGVAHLVIDSSLAHLAAFDMSQGNAQRQCGRSRGQHLIAIGNQQQQIRPPRSERIRQAQNRETNRLRHARVRVRTEQTLDPRLDRKSIALDLVDRRPKFRRKVRPKRKNAQLDLRMRLKLAQRPVQMAIVGAGSGDHPNTSALRRFAHGATREALRCATVNKAALGVKSGTSERRRERAVGKSRARVADNNAPSSRSNAASAIKSERIENSPSVAAGTAVSSDDHSFSNSLSPHRGSVKSMEISWSGASTRAMNRAKSVTYCGERRSGARRTGPSGSPDAAINRSTASSMVRK